MGEQGVTVSKKTEGNKFKRDAPAEETDGLLSNCFFEKDMHPRKWFLSMASQHEFLQDALASEAA